MSEQVIETLEAECLEGGTGSSDHCRFCFAAWQVAHLAAALAERAAEVERLREALEPLAAVGRLRLPFKSDSDVALWQKSGGDNEVVLKVSHAKRAAEVLLRDPPPAGVQRPYTVAAYDPWNARSALDAAEAREEWLRERWRTFVQRALELAQRERDGAEAMREAAASHCDSIGRNITADEVRALPLPGDPE